MSKYGGMTVDSCEQHAGQRRFFTGPSAGLSQRTMAHIGLETQYPVMKAADSHPREVLETVSSSPIAGSTPFNKPRST